jgi:hypothetical protein
MKQALRTVAIDLAKKVLHPVVYPIAADNSDA